jgi:hypothetical protein
MNYSANNQSVTDLCASSLLWFIVFKQDVNGIIHVTANDIATEFGVNPNEAQNCLDVITAPYAFVEKVCEGQYKLTAFGEDESEFLKRFVPVLSAYLKVNPRNAVRISVCLREWFKGINPQSLSEKDAKIMVRLKLPNKKWTDEEIHTGYNMYKSNAAAISQIEKRLVTP